MVVERILCSLYIMLYSVNPFPRLGTAQYLGSVSPDTHPGSLHILILIQQLPHLSNAPPLPSVHTVSCYKQTLPLLFYRYKPRPALRVRRPPCLRCFLHKHTSQQAV